MLDELLTKLQNIEESVGYTLIEPAQNKDTERLKEWISKNIQVGLWFTEYEDFLKKRNGLDFDGFIVYSSNDKDENNDFIEANDTWRDEDIQAKKYIFFGESSISWFVYIIETNDFAELDKPSGNFIKTYNSFNNMLENIVKRAIN